MLKNPFVANSNKPVVPVVPVVPVAPTVSSLTSEIAPVATFALTEAERLLLPQVIAFLQTLNAKVNGPTA